MAKALTRSQLKKKLDKEFSIYIRRRDSDSFTELGNCITCRKTSHWKQAHAGHYITRACPQLRYDEHNVHLQDAGCNTFRNGEPVLYRRRLVEMYGEAEVERLEQTYADWRSGVAPKQTLDELRELLEYYKEKNR